MYCDWGLKEVCPVNTALSNSVRRQSGNFFFCSQTVVCSHQGQGDSVSECWKVNCVQGGGEPNMAKAEEVVKYQQDSRAVVFSRAFCSDGYVLYQCC